MFGWKRKERRTAPRAGDPRPATGEASAPRVEPTPTEIVLAYHQTTKHHPYRQARSLGYLDWDTQPDPFRRFHGADLVALPLSDEDWTPPYRAIFDFPGAEPRPMTLANIAALFEHSLGITAWKEFQGSRWALRANPSSGNLHPTEGYAVFPAEPDAAWVAHYAPAQHAFERRARFTHTLWRGLAEAFPRETFFVGLTSIHWREAWKYGERAYRYCHHDTGHAWAALRIAAAALGWRLVLLEDLGDADVARLLGTDRGDDFRDGEREEADGLAAVIADAGSSTVPLALAPDALDAVATAATWAGRAEPLSPDHVEWNVIELTASAAAKPRQTTRSRTLPARAASTPPLAAGATAETVSTRRIITQRRSAVDLDGHTRITAAAFFGILARVLPRADSRGFVPPPWDLTEGPPRVHLVAFVHRVDGLAPGLYALPRSPTAIEPLRAAMRADFRWSAPPGTPVDLPFALLREEDCRAIAKSMSCGQDIAGDGVASFGMLAELEDTVRGVGPWAYRRLHWEAGMIGQVLYLEAEASGIRGTGIGCFFDDTVHDVLGIRGTRFHTLYHFTLGGPVDDPRLTTLPPYDPQRRVPIGH